MWVWRQCGAWLVAAAVASGVCAGQAISNGYFHGTLLSLQGNTTEGMLTVRAENGTVFDCGYDGKTYAELSKQRISPFKLVAGDPLDLLIDHSGRARACYLRIVRVLAAADVRPNRPKAQKAPSRTLTPVTTITLSGIVVSKEDGMIKIRGRDRDHEEILHVRRDTRFIGDGVRTDLSGLELNQRVFLEAGRNLDGELEVYQVTWGGILTVP